MRTPLDRLLIRSDQRIKDPEGNLTSKQTEYAKTIHSSDNALLMLVDDVLDPSQIESGTVLEDANELRLDDLRPQPVRPPSLLVLFAVWAAALIVGFGLVHHGLAPRAGWVADALYLRGTTFTTLGYGDLTPSTPAARLLAVAEAGTGFGFFAVVIGYLPVLYQSFGRREAFIALLDARAGFPPAAGRMPLRGPPAGDGRGCLSGFLGEAERCAAEVLEAHLSFPVLGHYRSQHEN